MKYVLLIGQDYEGCEYEKSFNQVHDILKYYSLNNCGDYGKVYNTDEDKYIGMIYTLEKLEEKANYFKRARESYGYKYENYKILDTFEDILMVTWG